MGLCVRVFGSRLPALCAVYAYIVSLYASYVHSFIQVLLYAHRKLYPRLPHISCHVHTHAHMHLKRADAAGARLWRAALLVCEKPRRLACEKRTRHLRRGGRRRIRSDCHHKVAGTPTATTDRSATPPHRGEAHEATAVAAAAVKGNRRKVSHQAVGIRDRKAHGAYRFESMWTRTGTKNRATKFPSVSHLHRRLRRPRRGRRGTHSSRSGNAPPHQSCSSSMVHGGACGR